MAYPLRTARRGVALVVGILWAASLALPAATFDNPNYAYVPGAFVGMLGLFLGWMILQPGAFANLALLALCVSLLFNRRGWRWVAVVMELLALWSFTWDMLPDDAGKNPINHFASGFYVWQLAILLLAIYVLSEKRLIARGKLIA